MGAVSHWPELLVLLLAALVIFGPKRLPEIGSSMGKGIKEFRKTMQHDEEQPVEPEVPAVQKPAQIASTPPAHDPTASASTPSQDHSAEHAAATTHERDAG